MQNGRILIDERSAHDALICLPRLAVNHPLCFPERSPCEFKRRFLLARERMICVGHGFGEHPNSCPEPSQGLQHAHIRRSQSNHKGIMLLVGPALAGRVISSLVGFHEKIKMAIQHVQRNAPLQHLGERKVAHLFPLPLSPAPQAERPSRR